MKRRIVSLVFAILVAIAMSSPRVGVNAATPRTENLFDEPPATPTIDLRPGPSTSTTPLRARPVEPLAGNPLWSIPLSSLAVTRDRPLFTPSRRPPTPAVATVARPQPVAAPVSTAAPEPFKLALVGTIAADGDSIAIFVEQDTKNVVRLRVGEAQSGWILRSVRPREVLLDRGGETQIVTLPKFSDPAASSGQKAR